MTQQITSLFSYLQSLRGEMKKSRFKIWLRAFLFFQFSAMFSFYFFRDIANRIFQLGVGRASVHTFYPCGLSDEPDCPHESRSSNSEQSHFRWIASISF